MNARILTALFACSLTVTACGEEAAETVEPEAPFPAFATVVRGPLADDAKAVHDMIAAGGEAAATEAGDLSHDALVSTALLGGEEGHFLGIDQWADAEAMGQFYSDPAFAEGLGAMFAGPPTVTTYARAADWHGWGELDSADDAGDYWFVVAAGTLAQPADEAQALHDMLAAGGEGQAKEAGDVAHVVFLGLEDRQQFLAVDVWRSADAIEAFYGNPDFQMGFASLFAEPPSVTVYRSTDWHQW